MMIFGSCAPAGRIRYDMVARPAIDRVAHAGDLIIVEDGANGIAAAYNRIIDRARAEPRCETLVLLHDDLEILDSNFRPKIMHSLRAEDIGLTGVIGGAGLTSLRWWDARRRFGVVFETRGLIDFGRGYRDVDAVDGMMLAIARRAFHRLSFDSNSFTAFHGYDVDYCFQVKAAGLRVRVVPVDVIHRTKTGYGDEHAFLEANERLLEKWGKTFVRPMTLLERSRRRSRRGLSLGVRRASRVLKTVG